MKLWVDDIRNAPDDTWLVARTITSAILILDRFRSDLKEISLDHDIWNNSETFRPVAYYIAAIFASLSAPQITIHSANPIGAREMQLIFEERGIRSDLKPIWEWLKKT